MTSTLERYLRHLSAILINFGFSQYYMDTLEQKRKEHSCIRRRHFYFLG